jgi:hypothetical protein
VHLVRILDQKIKQLQNRAIELVKVQWTWYGPEDTNWEHEDAMRAEDPHLFEKKCCLWVDDALRTMHK